MLSRIADARYLRCCVLRHVRPFSAYTGGPPHFKLGGGLYHAKASITQAKDLSHRNCRSTSMIWPLSKLRYPHSCMVTAGALPLTEPTDTLTWNSTTPLESTDHLTDLTNPSSWFPAARMLRRKASRSHSIYAAKPSNAELFAPHSKHFGPCPSVTLTLEQQAAPPSSKLPSQAARFE